jgi:sigma-54 specific flagellar transcriptional regulator A
MRVVDRIFYGQSEAMTQLKKLIDTCARSDASVLILGDTGVGKEVISRELHLNSRRSNGPLVPINCAAIPGPLLESELFGFTKGSFTGAISDRPGRFELANGGTLFLDEIGDMPLELQAKMLRVLEERVVEPLGGGRSKPIDVRVIAATHRNLEQMVKENRFRQDLYFRLNVLPLRIPSVVERRDDILAMCQFFAKKHAQKNRPITFTPQSAGILLAYEWPGNVREISNLMLRFSVLFAGERIDISSLPDYLLPEGLLKIINEGDCEPVEADVTSEQINGSAAHYQFMPIDEANNAAGLPPDDDTDDDISPFDIERTLRLSNTIATIPEEGIKAKQFMADIEIQLITVALTKSKGSVSQAAQLLHMQRTTLIQKIARYNIATAFI